MNPLVSIIVPVYNGEQCIEKCIRSILKQTYTNLEIICINDGSTDGTKECLNSLAQNDCRIKVIHNKNQGVSATRNCGIQNATGKYIQFVDSDDSLDTSVVECMVKAFDDYKVDLVICGYKRSDGVDIHVPMEGEFLVEEVVKNFYQVYKAGVFNQPWNKMYKKELIYDLFNVDMSIAEDAVFNIDYLFRTRTVCFLDIIGYFYVIDNPNSLSWRYNAKALESERKKIVKFKQLLGDYSCSQCLNEFNIEFEGDFLRCVNNMIYASGDSANTIIDNICGWVNDEIWKSVLLVNRSKDCFDNKKVRGYVSWFVRKGLIRKKLIQIVQTIKGVN